MLGLAIGMIIGWATASLSSGKEAGVKGPIGSLCFRIKDYVLHIHHWLYGGIFFAYSIKFFNTHSWRYDELLYGFLIGLILHGLTYKDFYKLVYKRV